MTEPHYTSNDLWTLYGAKDLRPQLIRIARNLQSRLAERLVGDEYESLRGRLTREAIDDARHAFREAGFEHADDAAFLNMRVVRNYATAAYISLLQAELDRRGW
jgi:hypothetical protein